MLPWELQKKATRRGSSDPGCRCPPMSPLPTAAKSETSMRRRDGVTFRFTVGLQGCSGHLCHLGTKGNQASVGIREETVQILLCACKSLPWSLRRSPRNHNPAEAAWGPAPAPQPEQRSPLTASTRLGTTNAFPHQFSLILGRLVHFRTTYLQPNIT